MSDLFPKTNSISPKEPIKNPSNDFIKSQKANDVIADNKVSSNNISNNNPSKPGNNTISNFETFIKLLNNNALDNIFSSFMFIELDHMIKFSNNKQFSENLEKFQATIKANGENMLDSLKEVILSSNKFSPAIFSALRNAISSNIPNEIKYSIIEFIRCYDTVSSSNHILNNMIANLKNISLNMNQSYSNHLYELINKLSIYNTLGSSHENINLIKDDIIPFLSDYITRSRDFGHIRDLISIFTADLVKYESGTIEKFKNALKSMLLYKEVSSLFNPLTSNDLQHELLFKSSPNVSKMEELLTKITQLAINDDTGTNADEIFYNILNSTLINKSVYLPLLHCIFPVATDENMMFSQIFIDPNDENENNNSNNNINNINNSIKCLIKFDIKDIGPFEMIITLKEQKISLKLNYPKYISGFKSQVRYNIMELLEKNNLQLSNLSLEEYTKPTKLTDVFPKIYERKDTINVKI